MSRMYKVGQRIRYQDRKGTIIEVDGQTGAIRAIKFDDGQTEYFKYLHAKQQQLLNMPQKDITCIAGRGWGKTRVIANLLLEIADDMPRSKGFLSSSTYGQILTKTVPEIISAWEDIGLREWKSKTEPGQFVIGKTPPPEWEKPYRPPLSYKNVITFYNGFTIEFLSMERPDLARGGSYDFGIIDEALLVEKDHIDKVLYPTIRGNKQYFSNCTYHHRMYRFSSMPWLTKGQYLLDYKEKAKKMPKKYGWLEGTVYDNIDVLGPDYIDRLRAELDPYTFALEVENKPSGKKQHGFYHSLDDKYHVYTPTLIYGENYGQVSGMRDRVKTAMVHISLDFHGWFKCATVYQERESTEYMIGSFYRKEQDGIDSLIDDICIEYADHKNKYVEIWGEPHGHDKTTFGGTTFEWVRARFNKNGWACVIKAPAKMSDLHSVRYTVINECLQETNPRLPKLRINELTCKPVIMSLQNAEVDDKFQKSKKDERNKSYNQVYATHFSDTVDYYIMQKYGSKMYQSQLPGRGSSRVS